MSDKNELFPFPPAPSETPEGPSGAAPLPPFPMFAGEPPAASVDAAAGVGLTPEDVQDLKKILTIYRDGRLGPSVAGSQEQPGVAPRTTAPAPSSGSSNPMGTGLPTPPSAPHPASQPAAVPSSASPASEADLKKPILDFFANLPGCRDSEVETKQVLLQQLRAITDAGLLLPLAAHLAGVFPVRESLRHGTPEQKLFATIALGDRFLQGISGLVFPQRQAILKAVAAALSDATESTTFLAMEGEPFNPQYHERIPGASASGRVVREMRGFLVIRKGTNQIMRLGRVWT